MLFVGIFALPHLCVLAFQFLTIGSQTPITIILYAWGTIFLNLLMSAASQAATVVAVSQVHLDRPAGVWDSFAKVKGKILGVIGLSMWSGFLIGLACLALIVPGILLAIRWSLAVPAKVLENRGVRDAMARSSALTGGNRGRIFVIWLLFFALAFGVVMLLQWPIQLAAGVTASVNVKGSLRHAGEIWQVLSLVAGFVSQCLVGSLATIAFSLVYYDERVRKEAFDLQLMMTTLDAPALQA